MSVEATLKKQAREILAKENWAKSIMGFLCVLSVCGITLLVIDFSTYLITDDILSKPINIAIMIAVSLVGIIGFILLSPFYTGYIKFVAECKEKKTGDVQNFVYYFAKKRYFKTLQLNIALLVRYTVLLIICALPLAAFLGLIEVMPNYETGFKIGALWTGIIGAIVFFVISRFYVMVQYLYVSDFDYKKEKDLIKASSYMVRKNLGKFVSLYLSFIGYWLLSFFMIPLVFVYPYFKHTAVLSYSYVYEIEKNNLSINKSNQQTGMQLDNEIESQSRIEFEGVINPQINNENNSENISNFDNNQQTNQNTFIINENSDIIDK